MNMIKAMWAKAVADADWVAGWVSAYPKTFLVVALTLIFLAW